jgi:hypothetical protein
MLARIDPKAGAAFALGSVAVNGPVHQIVTNAAGTVAYGVAGDPSDLGFCFRFDDTHGVWELGRTMSFEGTPHVLQLSAVLCGAFAGRDLPGDRRGRPAWDGLRVSQREDAVAAARMTRR